MGALLWGLSDNALPHLRGAVRPGLPKTSRNLVSVDKTAIRDSRLANLAVRFATGGPMLILIVAVIAFAPWQILAALALAAALFGMYEYRAMLAGAPSIDLPLPTLLVCTALIHGGGMLAGAAGQHAMLVVASLIWMAACLFAGSGDHARTAARLAMGIFGLVWVAWFLAHWPLIFRLADGPRWAVFLLLVLTGSDIMAYAIGSLIGRHALIPSISPRKSVEGLFGALIGGMLGGALAAYWLPWFQLQVPAPQLILLSTLFALAGQLGDLVASAIKRMAGVKDSGTFLPGHGGFLDRLDSLLLAPALLYYALELGLI